MNDVICKKNIPYHNICCTYNQVSLYTPRLSNLDHKNAFTCSGVIKTFLIFIFSLFRVLTQLIFFPFWSVRLLPRTSCWYYPPKRPWTVKGDKSFRIEGRFKTKLTTKKNWMSWFKHYQWHWFERCLKLVIFLNCFPSVSRTLHSLTEMSRYHW